MDAPIEGLPTVNRQYDSHAAYGDGMWLVVWTDMRESEAKRNIYASRVDDEGNVLDPTGILVGEIVDKPGMASETIALPAVSYGAGKWVVVWRQETNVPWHLRPRRLQPVPARGLCGRQRLGDRGGRHDNDIGAPDVAFGEGKWLVVWDDSRNSIWGYQDILGKYIASDGTVDEDPFTITSASYDQQNPRLAYGDDRWMVAWEDRRDTSFWGRKTRRSTPRP